MLKRLLRLSPKPEPREYRVPEGRRVYAIGDIHGRRDLLDKLLSAIDADDAARGPADTLLVILGDLVDRGPDSAGVVQRLLDLANSGRAVRFLAGNHEEVFLQALDGDVQALRFLIRIGGRETILSYGFTPEEYDALDFPELEAALQARVPQAHVDFLKSFEDMIEVGDYLFVHAGIRPGVALTDQTLADLRWIRRDFLEDASDHGKLVVHGHSISEDVDDCGNRIGIDTGAYRTGRLTAIGLEGAARWFLTS